MSDMNTKVAHLEAKVESHGSIIGELKEHSKIQTEVLIRLEKTITEQVQIRKDVDSLSGKVDDRINELSKKVDNNTTFTKNASAIISALIFACGVAYKIGWLTPP